MEERDKYNNLTQLAFIVIQTALYRDLQRQRGMRGPNSLKSMQGDNKYYVCDSNNRRRKKEGKTMLQVHHSVCQNAESLVSSKRVPKRKCICDYTLREV